MLYAIGDMVCIICCLLTSTHYIVSYAISCYVPLHYVILYSIVNNIMHLGARLTPLGPNHNEATMHQIRLPNVSAPDEK